MELAVKELRHTHIRCFAHTLQLCIYDCLKDKSITDIIDKAKRICKYFKKSTVAALELTLVQQQMGIEVQKLIRPNNTR
jgi:hypothetical protein